MMNYDMQQALCVPPSGTNTNTNNSNRVSPHLYYQQSHHLHHQQQQQQQQHRLKNEPFSPPISTRSSLNDTSKTPTPQQQRSIDYMNSSSSCSEPSLKHARFDPPVWPNTT